MSDVKTAYIVHFGYDDGDLLLDSVFPTLNSANNRACKIWRDSFDFVVRPICFVDVMYSDEKEIPLDVFSSSDLESDSWVDKCLPYHEVNVEPCCFSSDEFVGFYFSFRSAVSSVNFSDLESSERENILNDLNFMLNWCLFRVYGI